MKKTVAEALSRQTREYMNASDDIVSVDPQKFLYNQINEKPK